MIFPGMAPTPLLAKGNGTLARKWRKIKKRCSSFSSGDSLSRAKDPTEDILPHDYGEQKYIFKKCNFWRNFENNFQKYWCYWRIKNPRPMSFFLFQHTVFLMPQLIVRLKMKALPLANPMLLWILMLLSLDTWGINYSNGIRTSKKEETVRYVVESDQNSKIAFTNSSQMLTFKLWHIFEALII